MGKRIHIYGPPGCLAGDTVLQINRAGKGFSLNLAEVVRRLNGGAASGKRWHPAIQTLVQRADGDSVRLARVVAGWESGVKRTHEVTTETGRSIRATDEHPFLTTEGWRRLQELRVGDRVMVNAGRGDKGASAKPRYAETYTRFHPYQRRGNGGFRHPTHRLMAEASLNGLAFGEYVAILRRDPERAATLIHLPAGLPVYHVDGDHTNNRPENLVALLDQREHAQHHDWGRNVRERVGPERIVSVVAGREEMTYDIEVADDPRCFMANGFVVHNTGKTTTASRLIREEVGERGSDAVLVTSFTKAAAVQLVGRDLPIPDSQIGTLHAICYRMLGQPIIAESQMAEFKEAYPAYAMTSSSAGSDEPQWDLSSRTRADAWFSSYNNQRARMVPRHAMTYQGLKDPQFNEFVGAWEDFKQACEYMDFADLIEVAAQRGDTAPGDPKVIFIDEAQDCSAAELELIRRWGEAAEMLYVIGDDDQAIFSFKGADPRAIFSVQPDEAKVLAKSYRVPRAVHALATSWIEQCSWRIKKEYRPRNEIIGRDAFGKPIWGPNIAEGSVGECPADYADPQAAVKLAKRYVEEGKTVMFLATCSYMLRDTVACLKAEGLPFWNPLRPRRGDWNPLVTGSATRKAASDRVMDFLRVRPGVFSDGARVWDTDEFRSWADKLDSRKVFAHGAKTRMKAAGFSLPVGQAERIDAIVAMVKEREPGDPANFGRALDGDLDWLLGNLTGEAKEHLRFPIKIAQEMGPKALRQSPKVIVGTGHSVKGGEADAVFIWPDVSAAGMQEWQAEGPRQDSVRRLFYVMATRAKERVVLCSNATPNNVKMLPA